MDSNNTPHNNDLLTADNVLTDEEKEILINNVIRMFFDSHKDTFPEMEELFNFLNDKFQLLEAVESIKKDNPQLKNTTSVEFQQALKKYIMQTSPSSAQSETTKKNVIPKLDDYFALITDKDYKHALSPYKNPHAYIQQLDENFFQQLEFNPDTGAINIKGNLLETITLQNAKTRSNLKELDLPLLRSLYTIIYNYADKIDTDTVTISLPTLTKHLGINIRGDKPNDLFGKIKAFDNVIGVLENGSFYRLLTFLKYDTKTNSITFGSPYMNKILRTLQEVNTITPKKGVYYIKPHHSFLVHGSIANERNKPAIEIVNSIVTLLHQRGVEKPPKEELTADEMKKTVKTAIQEEFNMTDKTEPNENNEVLTTMTTMHKKISAIIEEIPILTETLEKDTIDKKTNLLKPKTAREKNIVLQRAFSGAYILLRTKTDIYKYFKDLTITEIIPTVSTVDQVIEISHAGINEKYKKD